MENNNKSYWRADVQGLRALAVVAVIAYHLGLPIKSGFLGVDIFIVLSGYVITGLLLREIELHRRIKILKFFKWRFVRLFPAHVVMLSSTLLIFYVVGPYGAHKAALNQARASVTSIANGYFFARPKDYFALGDDLTLFLNTWSLALEEQFYAIFAISISLFIFSNKKKKYSSKKIRMSLIWLFLIIIACSVTVGLFSTMVWRGEVENFKISELNPREWIKFLSSRGEEFAFYSPVTRAWQFLIGALLALRNNEIIKSSKWVSSKFVIVALVLVLTFASSQENVFFSWSRISATLLTAVVITKNSSWLSKKWLVAIGDRSYSLYLWHYPLIVIFKSINSVFLSVFALISIIFFSELSFRFIETPFRHSNLESSENLKHLKKVVFSLIFLSVFVVFLRLDVVAKNLIQPSHFVKESDAVSHFYDDETNCWSDNNVLTCGEDLSDSIVLVGDSHAGSLRPGFFNGISSVGLKPRFRDGRCLFASYDRDVRAAKKSGCDKIGTQLQRVLIAQRPRMVVFLICGRIHDSCPEGLESESEEDWVQAGKKALQPILDADIPVVLVRDLPVFTFDPRYAASVARSVLNLPIQRFDIDKGYERLSRSRFERLFLELTSSDGELSVVQLLDTVCMKDSCIAKTQNGSDIWLDQDHLSATGSLELSESIIFELIKILNQK